jgi:glycosyltransferase involved in cell wall biosynthesis
MKKQADGGRTNRLPEIAIISNEVYPAHTTITQQVVKNATALSEAGVKVHLLVPTQLKGLLRPGYSTRKEIRSYYNISESLKILTLPFFPANPLHTEKITHGLGAVLYAIFKGYEIIYTRHKLSAFFSMLLGKKTVFEAYRRFGDEYPRRVRWLSKWAKKPHFLGMILHSQVASDSMQRAGFPKEKLAVVHNGFDGADMQPRPDKEKAKRRLGWLADRKYVVYTGNMQANKCVESIVDIASFLPEVRFVLVGGKPEEVERLASYAIAKGIENVELTGYQPIKKISGYLYAADILIIPPVSAPMKKFGRTVLPIKTFLYLAAGRPIIAPEQDDLMEVLTNGYNALLVEPDNFPACAAAIRHLFADPQLAERLSRQALDSGKDLTWDGRAKKIARWLESVYQGGAKDFGRKNDLAAPANVS